jgi:hypothetical protein
VLGNGTLLHALIARSLIGEYLLLIDPFVLGNGLLLPPNGVQAHRPYQHHNPRADRDLPAGGTLSTADLLAAAPIILRPGTTARSVALRDLVCVHGEHLGRGAGFPGPRGHQVCAD